MLSNALREALCTLTTALTGAPDLAGTLYAGWWSGRLDARPGLDQALTSAAKVVDEEMPGLTLTDSTADEWKAVLTSDVDNAALLWCFASVARPDVQLADILTAANTVPKYRERVEHAARSRVLEGPLFDALMCVPLLGSGKGLDHEENAGARSRIEILLWEAGASAVQIPELGRWIWQSADNFDALVGRPAGGTLRGRVLAARCLEVAVCGMPAATDPQLVGRTLQVMQPLLLHPEPMVWIHAARSFGRLAASFEPLEGTVLDWVHGQSPVLRQRALTAFASLSSSRLSMLGHELTAIIDSPDEDSWVLAAAAAATPHLFYEKRKIWNSLSARILRGDGGAVSARALARGLASLWRRGMKSQDIEGPFRRLRNMARRSRTDGIDDTRRWIEVIAVTDPVDGAERDPLDIELGLENLVRLAAQYDDEEADARAARFAGTLAHTFVEAKRIALGNGSSRHRAAALNALEGCARSLALRLWAPLLATRPDGDPIDTPDLTEAWEVVAAAPAELLDLVHAHRQEETTDADFDVTLEVLALKLGGYALDACGEETELGPGRGPTAHDTCLWLRKLDGLTDGTRDMPAPLRGALSSLFWRLVDTTRGTSLGEVDDVEWLGPFAAWWALVIDRPAVLQQLATALPMIKDGVLEECCTVADETRTALSSGQADGEWGYAVMAALSKLKARDTELAESLGGFAKALAGFKKTASHRPNLEQKCMALVLAAERLRAALADPVRGLHSAKDASDDSLAKATTENAPRMASVVARAIKMQEIALLEVWFASLGTTVAELVEAAVVAAQRRSPPPPRPPKQEKPKVIAGYELLKPLGEGGIGSVWLVRKAGKERYFVLKIPKAEALANAADDEREGILASFVSEAKALAGLYHPNVANIIDRGVENEIPYLVLEYLIGADLYFYSWAKLMTLFELRQVVVETCAGLTALHNAGLVHRDIKPGNIWLRLPLEGGVQFDAKKHRDPAHTQPLSSVVIDFGMVRASPSRCSIRWSSTGARTCTRWWAPSTTSLRERSSSETSKTRASASSPT